MIASSMCIALALCIVEPEVVSVVDSHSVGLDSFAH